jgi:hypothetical protein
LIGNFYRNGKLYTQEQVEVNDHDFRSVADGMAVPHGLYDLTRYYIFKQDLQALAQELGIAIRIAHYPPYTSKYNPIEHRLFPHVTRACQGVIFKTFEMELI